MSLPKIYDALSTLLYKGSVWLQYRRSKGRPRVLYGIQEIDRLYEIEDFLRNSGESFRANQVNLSRKLLKTSLHDYDELADHYNDLWYDHYEQR